MTPSLCSKECIFVLGGRERGKVRLVSFSSLPPPFLFSFVLRRAEEETQFKRVGKKGKWVELRKQQKRDSSFFSLSSTSSLQAPSSLILSHPKLPKLARLKPYHKYYLSIKCRQLSQDCLQAIKLFYYFNVDPCNIAHKATSATRPGPTCCWSLGGAR